MFAVYLPALSGYDPQHLARVGLGDLLGADADVAPSFAEFSCGPDNGRGLCATWDKRPITGRDQFDWTSCRKGKFWLGKLRGEAPKPEWFARERLQRGKEVLLADGQEWQIPVARQLPRLLGIDDAGNLTATIVKQYDQFWEKAWETVEWFTPDDEGRITVDYRAGLQFVSLALSINYRVNLDVVSWLGLVRSDCFWTVADAVTEISELYAAKKKPEPSGPPISDGAAG